MYNPMDIVQVRQPLQNTHSHASDDLDLNRTHLFIYAIKGSAIHVFHAYTNVWIGEIRAIALDDVTGIAFVHDLEFAHDLFADTWLGIYEYNL